MNLDDNPAASFSAQEPDDPQPIASVAEPAALQFETVSTLTARLRISLETQFSRVLVEGEVSNWRPGPSGHIYFCVKDRGAVLNCVLWGATARRPAIATRLADVREGSKLQLAGKITVYEPRGAYQLVVSTLRLAGGLGDLWRQFAERKEKLEREGLFDPARKRPLPAMARRVGVVASAESAALRDVLNVARRRAPGTVFIVEHSSVQGAEAPPQLVAALERLGQRARAGEIDAAIICRGGGSLEDLWAFNDEAVVRAVAAFPVPIVCGVGHETDWTLCDFAADLRAPTPSAAAETATPDKIGWQRRLEQLSRRARRLMLADLDARRLRLERLARHPVFQDPQYAINRWRQRLDDWETRLERLLSARLTGERRRLDALPPRLMAATQRQIASRRATADALSARLSALDPRGVLKRGYAIVSRSTKAGDQVVASAQDVPAGSLLSLLFADGSVAARALGASSEDGGDQLELKF